MNELENGINVFLQDMLYDGLKDAFTLNPSWKSTYVLLIIAFGVAFIGFMIASFSGSGSAKFLSKLMFWCAFTLAILFPFLYWVDTSGFMSGLVFFVYFLLTYSVLGGGKGRASIAANLVAATILFGAILWYYTWDMCILWLRSVGLWLFLFNLFLFGGLKDAMNESESNTKSVMIGFFIFLFFAVVIFFGTSYMDNTLASKHWDGVKPPWD